MIDHGRIVFDMSARSPVPVAVHCPIGLAVDFNIPVAVHSVSPIAFHLNISIPFDEQTRVSLYVDLDVSFDKDIVVAVNDFVVVLYPSGLS